VNFADLARDVSVAPGTARRFLRYLELSYQVLVLQPYHRNKHKRLVKMPKIHFLDPGVQRAITGRRGTPTAAEFESAVVAEIVKQLRNAHLPVALHHLRTHDGREVDLLMELDAGFVAVEIKAGARVSPSDARHLRGLQDLLDKPLLKAFILSRDRNARPLEPGVLALPVAWALAADDGPRAAGR